MAATILDGRALAKEIQSEVQADVEQFKATYSTTPRLAVVLVEGDDASERYVRSIRKLCGKVGMDFSLASLPSDVSQKRLDDTIDALSADENVHGVLIEMPLPKPLSAEEAILHLDPRKDVDGIHPFNAGLLARGQPGLVPNTPAGGMALLKRYDINLCGLRVAMVGRSPVVGHPMAVLMMTENATVTVCNEYTPDLGSVVRECNVVVVAVGQAGLITGAMLQPGVVVVDFGINVLDNGQVVGDVDFASAVELASAITPVPGGTGPVTNAILLRNVLMATRKQVGET